MHLDTLESVSSIFTEECSMCLETFLSRKFADSLKEYINSDEARELPLRSTEIEGTTSWTVARPPHKHHFLFQTRNSSLAAQSPLSDLVNGLLPSKSFQKWLSLATGHEVTSHDSLIRRFRRGQDYTLATGYEEDSPRIEICLGLTPSPGWEGKEDVPSTETDHERNPADAGGYLAYMAGDEENDSEAGSDAGIAIPQDMSTGGRSSRVTKPQKAKQDPAIYQSNGDDEDDGVLFSMPASWNRLGVVLRDKSTMRFVKYVSRMAKGDRWDLVGEFGIVDEEEDDDDENEEENGKSHIDKNQVLDEDEEETEHDRDDVDDESDSED